MKLRTKFPLYTSITVLITVSVVTIYAILDYRQTTLRNIEMFKQEEIEKVKQHLKDIVDIAYEMVSVSFQNAHDMETVERLYSGNFNSNDSIEVTDQKYKEMGDYILNLTLENLRVLRYAGDGYIWINNVNKPYRVVMHPINPELEGQKLDGPQFNLVKGSKQNIYAYFAEIVRKDGEGYSEYHWYKPGERDVMPKISYLKLFEPMGWVIGTGVYVDNIDKIVKRKKEELSQQINRMILLITLLGIILTLSAIVWLRRFANNVTESLNRLIQNLRQMAQGMTVDKIETFRDDEIGEMEVAMGGFIDGVATYNEFAREIGKGNLSAKFEPLSNQDKLGNSLLDMRDSLSTASNEELKRKAEDAKRNWATEGYAKFGEILRENTSSADELTNSVIRNIVKYLKANQGGLFTVFEPEEEPAHLVLSAAFAYDQKKFIEKKVDFKEGLIGTCAVEKKTIYMTDVPNGYMEITSGLGEATPRCLLIVPLKIEEEVMGVLEIASFEEFQPHEIKFVEQLGESISGTLKSVQINAQTARLLEETRIQSDEMVAQEEEMRQNLEELRATQEEATRKEVESSSLIEILDNFSLRMELTTTGEVEFINENFVELLGMEQDDILGDAFNNFIDFENPDEFMTVWDQITEYGTAYETKLSIVSNGKVLIINAVIAGIIDIDDEVNRLVIIGNKPAEQ